MKTGTMPSVSTDTNVNGKNKTSILVDYKANGTQSTSRGRGGRMDLGNETINPMKPSNRDTFQ